jgi:hypothetical protein
MRFPRLFRRPPPPPEPTVGQWLAHLYATDQMTLEYFEICLDACRHVLDSPQSVLKYMPRALG